MRRLLHSAIAAAMLAFSPSVAPAADLVQQPDYYSGECANPRVLNRIVNKFRYQVTHVPHLPNVDIVEFRDIYQNRYLPNSPDWPIARRYCGATVLLSDGYKRPVWYLIEYGQGIIGIGNNVEFCVSGFDRWYVYNGHCRVLR